MTNMSNSLVSEVSPTKALHDAANMISPGENSREAGGRVVISRTSRCETEASCRSNFQEVITAPYPRIGCMNSQ
jgi:hypothetical protein